MSSESLWKEAKDTNGRTYYYNAKTGESRWDKPKELLSEQELILAKHGWKSSKTPDGKVYYYNSQTKASRWNLPDLPEFTKAEIPKEDITRTAEIKERADEGGDRYANPSRILNTSKKPKEEAKKEFIRMLQDNQVDSVWSFSRIISEMGSKDPRYWMVEDDPLYRQQLFEEYFTSRSEEQLIKERTETSKFNEAFWEMLKTKPQIRYYTRWSTARRLISNEPIYKHSVVKESVKKQRFLEYVASLREEHEESQRQLKSQALDELRDYLENILLSSDTRTNSSNNDTYPLMKWQSLVNNYLFEKNKRYMANKHFKVLTHEDVLQTYMDIVKKVEKNLNEKFASVQKINYTKDRIARDGFKQLLRSPDIKIRANSKWQDIYPLIKNDSRFLQMLGTSGSSPLDLFLDIVEERSITIAAQRSIAQNILIENSFKWDENDENEDRKTIKSLLRDSGQFSEVDDDDINLIIDQLFQLQGEKQRKQKILEQRAFEERKHFFKLMLRRIYGAVKPKPKTWEAALNDIQHTREFRELPDEQIKRQLFDEFTSEAPPARPRPSVPYNPKKRSLGADIELDY